MNLNLKEMTTEEKLQTMEILWDDICRIIPDFSSPSWHEDILKEREQNILDGKVCGNNSIPLTVINL
jgi:hypothetical protein